MALVNFHKLFKISFVFYSVCLTGGISGIVNVYASLIKKGLKTLDDVPMKLREAVVAALEEADGK